MKLYVRTRSGKPPTSKLASNLSFIISVLHIKATVSIWKEWVGWIIHKSGIVIMTLVQFSFYVYPFLVIRDPTSPPNWFAPQTLVRDRQSLGLPHTQPRASSVCCFLPAVSLKSSSFAGSSTGQGEEDFGINVNISSKISEEVLLSQLQK